MNESKPGTLTVGCFEIREMVEVERCRWAVKNLLTEVEYVTFGTLQEVREELLRQTEAWERKRSSQKMPKGHAWRSDMHPKKKASNS